MYAELILKTCSICRKKKDRLEFHARRSSPDGVSYICRVCNNDRRRREYKSLNKASLAAQQKTWREKNKKRISDQKRKSKYGLNSEEQEAMLISQENSCAICKTHESKLRRRLAIDHCHISNKVRGLLCDNCNRCLGLLRDNLKIVLSAAQYLRKYQK